MQLHRLIGILAVWLLAFGVATGQNGNTVTGDGSSTGDDQPDKSKQKDESKTEPTDQTQLGTIKTDVAEPETYDVMPGEVFELHTVDFIDVDDNGWYEPPPAIYKESSMRNGEADSSETDNSRSEDRGRTARTPVKIDVVAYPNPTANVVTVEYGQAVVDRIYLTDASGRVLEVNNAAADGKVRFDLTARPTGRYIVVVQTAEQSVATTIIKQ